MIHDPSSPVIVGAGIAQQRFDDPAAASEAGLLIRTALELAADDAGSRALLDRADVVMMPQGTWRYENPVSIVAPWNPAVRSIVADMGVLQQTLIGRACSMVADGAAEIVLVCGGEAKFRALRSQITDAGVVDSTTAGGPTERLVPAHDILTTEEIARGLPVPARQYAMIDTALRRAQGLSPREHIDALAGLWSSFSAIAVDNPTAWNRAFIAPDVLVSPSAANPMLAWPYTKLHCSQWNVDQAAALIICSAATAARFGVSPDRWVFAHVGVESNLMVPLTLRAEMHRSPAVRAVDDAIASHTGTAASDIAHLDIYSCFPAAVRVQANEFGLDTDQQLTVTGGMTFGGGPLNNYTLQGLATMVDVLRRHPDERGAVTNVSGMLTKFGASVWSCEPPLLPFAAIDVTAAATASTATVSLDPDYAGAAVVATYTVAFDRGQPVQGIVVGDAPAGVRCLATTSDPELIADMLAGDWCGETVIVDGATIGSAHST